MPLEDGLYVFNLNPDNPAPSDTKREGDDHLRLIKKVLRNTFPTATSEIKLPRDGPVFTGSGNIVAADNKTHFFATTGGIGITIVLPTVGEVAAIAGWTVSVTKVSLDPAPIVITSGNPTPCMYGQGGLVSFLRREVPLFTTVIKAVPNSGFICSRAFGPVVGTAFGCVVNGVAPGTGRLPGTIPCYGGTIAASSFPELVSVVGGTLQNYGPQYPSPETALIITE